MKNRRRFTAAGLAVVAGLVGAASGQEVLYAIGNGFNDASSNLYRIDDPFGIPVALDLGEAGTGIFDIAISPVSHKAYGIAGAALYSIDLNTAEATLIGAQGFDSTQNALEFTPDGTLYSWGFDNTTLFRVDPATGRPSRSSTSWPWPAAISRPRATRSCTAPPVWP
jgi:hypothetical protein